MRAYLAGLARLSFFAVVACTAAVLVVLSLSVSPWCWPPAMVALALTALGVWDLLQRRHSILRNYPILGHLRFLLEGVRPEMQQYFIERNVDGRPYDRDVRSLVYERAKGTDAEEPFGTEREVDALGYQYLVPSMAPKPVGDDPPKVRVGGPDCTRPYDMALLNVSAMSFGALSTRALLALNEGAARAVSPTTQERAGCPSTTCDPVGTSSGRSAPDTSAAAPRTVGSTSASSPKRPPIRRSGACR